MSAIRFFSIDEEGIAFLRTQWRDLTERCATSNADALFGLLAEHYSEEGRVYHNLSHVKALLILAEQLKNRIENYDAVRFAIWFHDAIYDSHKNDNEDKSAEWAEAALSQLSVPAPTTATVRDMILATKHHQSRELAGDVQVFLDLDLSILGARADVYKEYSRAIREEYSWVPGLLYRRGRKKILKGFLERESIYQTEELSSRFESPSRRNIEDELRGLS